MLRNILHRTRPAVRALRVLSSTKAEAAPADVYNKSPFVNVRDLYFMASEFINGADLISKIDRYEEHDMDSLYGILSAANSLAEDKFLPLLQVRLHHQNALHLTLMISRATAQHLCMIVRKM